MKRSKNRWRSVIGPGLLAFYTRHIAFWLLLSVMAYWMLLDNTVVRSFAERRWDVPARVYASPLELYEGARLGTDYLESTLLQLGYQRQSSIDAPGRFSRTRDGFAIFSRGHNYPEGAEPARRFNVHLVNGSVADLTEVETNKSLPLARLEPIEIGTVHAKTFEDRVILALSDTPQIFLEILIAVEDRRFSHHFGIDPMGIARAAIGNVLSGNINQGGSTITQQLVKNMYLSNERSYRRKFRETLMAISLERRFGKAEIIEAYINEIFLGQDGNRAIHGFGLGARYYFGKLLADLNLAEMATLIGMVKAPSTYNPQRHADTARKRRDVVLILLREQGVIDNDAYDHAIASKLIARGRPSLRRSKYGAFIELVKVQLKRDYRDTDLQTAGLRIYTTLDPRVQQAATETAGATLRNVEQRKKLEANSLQTAMVVIDPRTAEIKGFIGGRSGSGAGFNRALYATRPIGSLVKPFVYLAALEQTERFNVLSMVQDETVNLTLASGEVWSPKNYDGIAHGQISLRQALAKSYNLATVNLGLKVGVENVAARLKKIGLNRDVEDFPSLLLGAVDMTPLEVVQLYQAIANDGFKIPLRAIRSVGDAQDRILTRYPPRVEQVIDAAPVYLAQYLLMRAVSDGTAGAVAKELREQLPLAGKTGTTNGGRDSWFAGFGGNYLAVVWVGRDDNGATGLTGASGALTVWIDLMRRIGITAFQFGRPEHLRWEWVTPSGDFVVSENCPRAIRVPLALPHGLPVQRHCGLRDPIEHGLWDRVRGLFQ